MSVDAKQQCLNFDEADAPTRTTNSLKALYLADLAAEPNSSENTVRAYTGDIDRFVDWWHAECVSKSGRKDDVRLITRFDIRAYLLKLDNEEHRKSTQARAMSAIREWFRWMGRKSYILTNEALEVSTPQVPEHLPHVQSPKNMERLCDSAGDGDSRWPARDSAIIELLYCGGFLTSELAALDVDDVVLADEVVHVRGKGSTQRDVPIGEPAVVALNAYLNERKDRLRTAKAQGTSTPALFINYHLRNLDQPDKQARLTTRSICRIVKDIAIQLGLSPDINPRALRTACVVHMIDGEADLRSAQQFLGHENIKSTERFKRMAKGGLKAELERTHPHGRKN
jgi:site-specific recombinase XerD